MTWRTRLILVASTCLVCGFVLRPHDRPTRHVPRLQDVSPLFGAFEPTGNDAQSPGFTASNGRETSFISSSDASFSVLRAEGREVRMRLAGAAPALRAEPIDQLPGQVNYLIGNDPSRWRTGVRRYAGVRFARVYRGIDLVYRNRREGVEYDFIVEPGAEPERIRLTFDGLASPRIDDNGDLVLQTDDGEIRHQRPRIYQDVGGTRREIDGTFEPHTQGIGFSVRSFDRGRPLTIDPIVVFTSKFGRDFLDDFPRAIATDSDGNSYVAGSTVGNLPTTVDAVRQESNGYEGFVAKLDARGNLAYLTYLGGNSARHVGTGRTLFMEGPRGIAMDPGGQVVVAGSTNSTNFPTVNAFQPMAQGPDTDGFIARLNASGSRLTYSTYLGGADGSTTVDALSVDALANVYVTGLTRAAQFPAQRILGPPAGRFARQLFVVKFNSAGGLVYSTRFGSSRDLSDRVGGIAVDGSGLSVVVGHTEGRDFPIVNAALPSCQGNCVPAFVTKLNASGTDFVYSTYLGTADQFTQATAAAADGLGNVYVGAAEGGTAIVARYNPRGEMTFLQRVAPVGEDPLSIRMTLDLAGGVYFTGNASTPNIPAVHPLLAEHPRGPVYRSINGGTGWAPSSRGALGGSVNALAFDAAGRLWAETAFGTAVTSDSGATWQSRNTGFILPRLTSFAADPKDEAVLYAVVGDGPLIYKTIDGGKLWTRAASFDTIRLSSVQTLVIDPVNTNILYIGGISGIEKSVDGGRTFAAAGNGITPRPDLTVFSLVIDPTNTSTLYAGSSQGIFKSTDGARTWTRSGAGLPLPTTSGRLAIDPFAPNVLYAASGRLFKSIDAGATWNAIGVGPPSFSASMIALDPRVRGTMYAARQAAGPEMVFKSTDAGATWIQSGTGILNDTVNALAIDPRSGFLYAAGTLTSVPFVLHMIPDAPEPVFSSFLPSGRHPAITARVPGEIFLAMSDSGIAVQRISENDCQPCVPRKLSWIPRVCGC